MRRTVLIADDDLLFRSAVADGLGAAGYQVVVASNGLEVLALVRESPPDFILLDLIMPKLDGIRACKLLKRHPRHRTIPIILLTGVGPEGLNTVEDLDAEGLVAKREANSTLAELLQTLERLASTGQPSRPTAEAFRGVGPRRVVSELLAERRHTQTLLDTLGEGVIELDEAGQVVYINPAGLLMLGRTEEETLGTRGANLFGAANASLLAGELRELQAGGRHLPVRLELMDGQRIIGVTLSVLRRPEGPSGALIVLRDLTEVTRRARILQAMATVGQHILGQLDLAELFREIVAQMADLIGAERCGLFRVEGVGERRRVRCIRSRGLSERHVQDFYFAPGEGAIGKAVQERRPVYTADLLDDPQLRIPGALHALAREEGLGAVLAAPILLPTETFGALVVFRPAGHEFSPDEVELVTSLAGSAAIAIENARLFQQEQERRRQVEAMRAVTAEITRELDLTALLGLIHRRAAELVGAVSGTLYLWDEASRTLVPRAWHGLGEWVREARVRLGEGVAGTVAQRRQGMIVNDYRTSRHAHPFFVERSNMTAAVAEPLLYRDRLVGVIAVNQEGSRGRFRERDRELLALFAAQAAIAIENARLYEDSQRRTREATALAQVGHVLSESLDMGHVLERVVHGVRQVMDVPFVGILKLDEERRELAYVHGVGLSPERTAQLRLKVGEGVAGRAVAEGVPCQSPDLLADPAFVNKSMARQEGFRSVLCAPLLARGKPLGVLAVFREDVHEFAPAEVQLLARFADQAAMALENARLYGEVKGARDFLQSIAANSADAIFTTDIEGRLTYVSPGAEEMLGYPAHEALRLPAAAFSRGGQEEARTIMQRLLAEGRIQNYETSLRARDGRCVEVSVSMSLLRDAAGAIVGTVRIARDVTERKRAEEELRKLSRAVEQSPSSIIITDPAGRIEYVNPKFTEVTGYTLDEVRGKNPRILKSGETPPQDYRGLWETISSGKEWRGEFHNRRKNGTLFWEAASISPIKNPDGVITHFLAVKEDITERKRADEHLRQSEKLATMGELLAGVAHELNNPLSVVTGQATLLGMAAGDGPLEERAAKIIEAAARCSRIVKNFLALARQHPPERQQVQLNQIIQEVLELLAYPLRVDGVQVAMDLRPDLPVFWADPHQLHQVLVNLITNAQHAMHEAPPPRQLRLATRYDAMQRQVLLEVADTGPGIPPEIRNRIFEPFFTTKPPGEGTGLGLSLCQGIVEGHGGTIRVDSPPGHGTVFQIVLPVEILPPSAGAAPSGAALRLIREKTILVVDDDPPITDLLAQILVADGHSVETATRGIDALAKLKERSYDLILTDIRMPGLDGPGLQREVERCRPELARRFVFLTGDALTAETREFLERCGMPSLAKPFTLESVRHAVQQALRRP